MNKGKAIPVYDLNSLVPSIKWGSFAVERFEDSFNNAKGDVYAPHRHDLYEVFWISEGQGICWVDFQPYEIQPPMLVFIAPGQIHSWSLTAPFAGYILLFNNGFFATRSIDIATLPVEATLFEAPSSGPTLNIVREHGNDFSQLFQKLDAEFQSSQQDQDVALHAYLHLIMIAAKRLSERLPGTTHKDESTALLTKKFLQLLERNFMAIVSVADYAEMLNVTANHLIETTKRSIGKPAGRIIRERVLLEAKRLLWYSELSASDIAYQLSFEDSSYFSRFFKKYTGMCPMQFRGMSSRGTVAPQPVELFEEV